MGKTFSSMSLLMIVGEKLPPSQRSEFGKPLFGKPQHIVLSGRYEKAFIFKPLVCFDVFS